MKKAFVDFVAEMQEAGVAKPGDLTWDLCVALQAERDQLVKGVTWIIKKLGGSGRFDAGQKELISNQFGHILEETRRWGHGDKVRSRIKRLRTKQKPSP